MTCDEDDLHPIGTKVVPSDLLIADHRSHYTKGKIYEVASYTYPWEENPENVVYTDAGTALHIRAWKKWFDLALTTKPKRKIFA